MMRKSQLLIYIVLVISVIGCAQPIKKPPEKIVEVPEEKPPEKIVIVEAPEEKFFKECLQKGRMYEDKGDMVAALKQYKIAMTVDPRNQEAIENRSRVELELRNLAEEHYKVGLKISQARKIRPCPPRIFNYSETLARLPGSGRTTYFQETT